MLWCWFAVKLWDFFFGTEKLHPMFYQHEAEQITTEFTVVLHKAGNEYMSKRPTQFHSVAKVMQFCLLLSELEYLLPHPGPAAVAQLASS